MEDHFISGAIALLVIAALGLSGYAIVGAVRSNGETDYCYTECLSLNGLPPAYQLWAHRPWRQDRLIGTFPSIEGASKSASDMVCPVGAHR